MSDYLSSLPVRTESDADAKLQTKVVDYTTASQGMTVDSDGLAHVEVHGNNPAGGDKALRLSELGAPNPDGVYDVTNNTKPAHAGLVVSQRAASPADSDQVKRVTAVSNSDVHAMDISLHDEDGAAYSKTNPLPVEISDGAGDEIHNYNTAAAVASAGTSNHDYPVTAGKTLELKKIMVAGSAATKAEVQIEDGVAAGTYTTFAVKFGTASSPSIDFDFVVPKIVAAQVNVRVIRTNRDNQSQDLYSTIIGREF